MNDADLTDLEKWQRLTLLRVRKSVREGEFTGEERLIELLDRTSYVNTQMEIPTDPTIIERLASTTERFITVTPIEGYQAGMGGAAESGSPPPMRDPGPDVTVYDEIIERDNGRSVSTSAGVGPMVDPQTGVEGIDDPAVYEVWWPPKVDHDPQHTPRPSSEANLRKST